MDLNLSCAVPTFRMLTRQHCEVIHRQSLELLRSTGVRVFHEGALDLLRQTGEVHTEDDNLVHFEPGLVEWALRQPPSTISLCERGTDEVIAPLEGRRVNFGTGSDCLTYLDPRNGERRKFTHEDVVDSVHVVDACPELQFCMSMGVISDHPYLEQFALMLQHTTKPIVFVCDDRADAEAIVAMTAAAAGGMDRLRRNPSLLIYTEPSSPLRHSFTAVDKLLYMAEKGLPIVHSPAPVQGGTATVTLAGALIMANAEILSGLVMHQLKRKGAPWVYGSGMHQLDMKTTISVYTSPEFVLARTAVAEMGRFYDLPTWGYAGDVNSCVVDEQAASEATFSILMALLAGNNLTHDIGYAESGKTTSPELIVLCDEIISMLRHYMSGIAFDENAMAMDVIQDVGPDGDFLSTKHTFENFRDMWQPQLFSRLDGEAWAADGHRRLGVHLREKTMDIIENHEPEPLSDGIVAEIEAILKDSERDPARYAVR
jgi:trimethylamine--corrinoid protein Co-methyltransferase